MPAGLVVDDDSVGTDLDDLGDLREMQAHGFAVAAGQDQAGGFALSRTDGAEEPGRTGPLVTRCRGPAAAFGPPAGDLVLLADAGLVLEPNLYLFAAGLLCGNLCQLDGKVFLKAA
jgi:hypothetical protein